MSSSRYGHYHQGSPARNRHGYGSATPKQLRFIGKLADDVIYRDPESYGGYNAVVRAHGGPDHLPSMTKFQASLIIESLLRTLGKAAEPQMVDPGELAADRWNEGVR